MMRSALLAVCCATGLGALTGCEQEHMMCTAIFAYGLTVEVQDSVTGAGLAEDVSVTAVDGSYQETLQTVDSVHFSGAGERAGNYTVRVSKAGYTPWERTGIEVTKDACHVHGVPVVAKLQR